MEENNQETKAEFNDEHQMVSHVTISPWILDAESLTPYYNVSLRIHPEVKQDLNSQEDPKVISALLGKQLYDAIKAESAKRNSRQI